jgi:hypothetical protein
MRRRFAWLAAMVSVAALAVGCSTLVPKTLDTGALEGTLRDQIEAQLDVTGLTVDCPDGVKAKAGGTFECTATTGEGNTLTIRVTQADDEGRVTYSLVGAGAATGATGSTGGG